MKTSTQYELINALSILETLKWLKIPCDDLYLWRLGVPHSSHLVSTLQFLAPTGRYLSLRPVGKVHALDMDAVGGGQRCLLLAFGLAMPHLQEDAPCSACSPREEGCFERNEAKRNGQRISTEAGKMNGYVKNVERVWYTMCGSFSPCNQVSLP